MPTPKTPKKDRPFVPGPALDDTATLLAWLTSNPGVTLRLPVVLRFPLDNLGGHDLAFIGTEPGPPADDAIRLHLDDSTLGIPLSDRLRSLCETGDCVVWIEGIWGLAIPALDDRQPPPWPLTVHDTGPRVEGSPGTIFVAR